MIPLVGCEISPRENGAKAHLDASSQFGPSSSSGDSAAHVLSNVVTNEYYQHGANNITRTRATLGRMASFKCTADKNLEGKKMVSWVRHRDVSLLAVGKFVYTSDSRFKVLHEPDSDEWFLVIKSVSYGDEGIYECQINAQPAYNSHKYMLSVVEPRTEILGEKDLFVDYASSLNLTCLVISPDPPAYVFWKQDQKLVEVSESSGSKTNRRRNLWSNGGQGQGYINTENYDDSNLRIEFAQNHPRPGITLSSLLIKKVNASHSGLFSCLPSNSESQSIRVHVLKDDSHPAAIHTTSSGANRLLFWSPMPKWEHPTGTWSTYRILQSVVIMSLCSAL